MHPVIRELDSTYMTTQLRPGRISPQRKVPPHIQRPEYVGKDRPKTGEPDVKSPEIIAKMRVAGQVAAHALEEVGRHVRPGITTDELDQIGHDFLVDHDAYPSTLGYRRFPQAGVAPLDKATSARTPAATTPLGGGIH